MPVQALPILSNILYLKVLRQRSGLQLEAQIKSLGGDMGAYTTLDHTTFKIDGSSDGLLPLLDIFYDIISNPLFDAQEFEKEEGCHCDGDQDGR